MLIMAMLLFVSGCASHPLSTSAPTPDSRQKPAKQISGTALTGLAPGAAEAQIIRELHQSGCLIEQFELNRIKQQIRISCAPNDIPGVPTDDIAGKNTAKSSI